MQAGWLTYTAVAAASLGTAAVAVLLHYQGMVLLGKRYSSGRTIRSRDMPKRGTILKVFGWLFLLHVAEIVLFGLVFWGLLSWLGAGAIRGADDTSAMQAIYMSAVTFTTVGFGNVSPLGPIRFLAGTEALIGFMLITWSASFTFLHMSRHWEKDEEGESNEDEAGEGDEADAPR